MADKTKFKGIRKEMEGDPKVDVQVGEISRTTQPIEMDASGMDGPQMGSVTRGQNMTSIRDPDGLQVYPNSEMPPAPTMDDYRTGAVAAGVKPGQYSATFPSGQRPDMSQIPGYELPEDEQQAAEDKKKALQLKIMAAAREK